MKKLIMWVVLGCLLPTAVMAQALERAPETVKQLRSSMKQAKKDGAKRSLPQAWWNLDHRLDAAEKKGATVEDWRDMTLEAQRLRNAAVFLGRMRQQKSGLEALLGRFDQALREIAAVSGVALDSTLVGTPAAADLLSQLAASHLQRQVLVDSLTVTNRHLRRRAGTQAAYRDSALTALRVEVSALRKQLWESDLRVGVAEADRSAAESVLTAKQARDTAIATLRTSFTKDEGEVLLTPEGTIVMRVYGIAFGVGSAELRAGQQQLLDQVVAAIQLFPGMTVRVEGHTDDTGSRQANLSLSQRRATAVAEVLAARLSVPVETIATAGFGPDRPLALNSTPEGRALNRRIDVVLSGDQ